MAWIYLLIAGVTEIVWAAAMKSSMGYTRLTPTLIMAAFMVISFGFLGIAMQRIPIGTSYAVWTGIGAVGTFIVGVVFFGNAFTMGRVVSIGLMVAGLIGLRVFS